MQREQPWHTRILFEGHRRKYENLCDIHALTQEWAVLLPQVEIEKLPPVDELPASLDDTSPDDFLDRLENKIKSTQIRVLTQILEKTSIDQSLISKQTKLLEQSSFEAGLSCAQRRWPVVAQSVRSHAGLIFQALRNCFFWEDPDQEGFLVKRSISNEVQFEFLICPHQFLSKDLKKYGDTYCYFIFHWIKGYVSHFNPKILMTQKQLSSERCQQQWLLVI